jgi:hypothetical protein
MKFTEFDKKYNTRRAACCRNCQSFIFEKEMEIKPLCREAIIVPEKRTILFGDCKVAIAMGNSVTKTTSDTVCDAYNGSEKI